MLRKLLTLILVVMVLLYGLVYFVWSRPMMAIAKQNGIHGFYYIMPSDKYSVAFTCHSIVRILFVPANLLDHHVFGSDLAAGSEPLYKMESH